ncbi:phosphotransferase family protein [Alkalibacterium sp. 20]|uniref:phosphotransferase family protein n=1 Tax=Alkalibacterium sp. 20 TaxID=1798803 RepID=UPI0009003C19|nr:aminoglycoside phosphotransferase family protein [Alkalibacterium sp. 20]OJF94731.1 hypothetical protein AX762_07200 [Alkalibacterium sp. 20]
MKLSNQTSNWLERDLKCKLINVKPLLGGTSSRLWLLTAHQGGEIIQIALREYTDLEWLAVEPEIAEQEARNLLSARHLSFAVPVLLAADPYAFKTTHPTVAMSYVAGDVVLDPADRSNWIEKLAETLAQLHTNEIDVPYEYIRYFDPETKVKAVWSTCPDLWKQAFDYLNQKKQPEINPIFIHRDFHPTNVLFKDSNISGVVDWSNACMGPREVDVAHCRWNLTMLYGLNVADEFLEAYLKYSTLQKYDPYWDLEALGNVYTEEPPAVYAGWKTFGKTNITAALMRERMDTFLVQALEKIKNDPKKIQ